MTDSLIDDYLNQLAQKKTSTLWSIYTGLDKPAPLVLNGDGAPAVSFRLKITVAASGIHTDVAGTVTINGTEVITFTVATTKTTTTTLTALPSITTANLDCSVVITAISTSGSDLYKTSWEDFACRWVNEQKEYQSSTGTWLLSNNKVKAKNAYTAATVIRKYGTTTEYTIQKVLDAVDLDGDEDYLTYIT